MQKEVKLWQTIRFNLMAGLGVVSGVGDGRFDPEGKLTREQSILTIGRLFDIVK